MIGSRWRAPVFMKAGCGCSLGVDAPPRARASIAGWKNQRQCLPSTVPPMPLVQLEQLPPRAGKGDLLRLVDEIGGLPGLAWGGSNWGAVRASLEVPSGWEVRLASALDGATLHGRKIRALVGDISASTAPAAADHFAALERKLELDARCRSRTCAGPRPTTVAGRSRADRPNACRSCHCRRRSRAGRPLPAETCET